MLHFYVTNNCVITKECNFSLFSIKIRTTHIYDNIFEGFVQYKLMLVTEEKQKKVICAANYKVTIPMNMMKVAFYQWHLNKWNHPNLNNTTT